ncbi:MAG: hypothetical protein HY859_10235 [Caulobacterales bacterium]|nr:hypothetical protein [Caulobacterales bacterium]
MTGSIRMTRRVLLAGTAIVWAGAAAPPAAKQVVTGPVATYWMSAQTTSGMTMGGGRPSMSSIMGGMRGDNVSRSLLLQLGSTQRPTGPAAAEHLPPSVLGAGPSLPLLTPKPTAAPTVREEPGQPQSYEKPKGRMLIYWGCGERARPGQPMVIDFSKMAAGQIPPEYSRMLQGFQITPAQPPSPTRSTTYGEWPNEKTRTQVPGDGSLIGAHTIRGTYSPQIQFSLAAGQDFLPPVRMTANSQTAAGAFQLGWRPVTGATGYIASTMGSDGGETIVLWSSSEVSSLMFALPDYLRPADVTRLLASKALMPPTQTSCMVPREVAQAAPQSMYQFVAYGGETNLSWPERPADPKVAWNIAWTVKVRYRSATGGILGMEMPGADDEDDGDDQRPGQPPAAKPRKPKGTDILRGLGVPIPGGR